MKKEPTMHRFFFYAFPYHFIQNKGGKIVKSPPFTDKNTPISGFFYQKMKNLPIIICKLLKTLHTFAALLRNNIYYCFYITVFIYCFTVLLFYEKVVQGYADSSMLLSVGVLCPD